MKKMITLIALLCITITLSIFTPRRLPNAIFAAGTALKSSANWQWAAWGSAAVGGATLVVGFDKKEDALKIVGYTCMGFALVSQVVSITKKYKAGKQLQIGAGKITYTF